ncbi:MAG: PilT/PilU family type 4a pilus ATPase [Clostridiales bacterium]|nr:PilT/PilU family type 4a pilus ATPase [Clostridiales bacterium]
MIRTILEKQIERNCSDAHITVGEKTVFREKTVITRMPDLPVVSIEDMNIFMSKNVSPMLYEAYIRMVKGESLNAVDFSFAYGGRRFRGNVCRSSKGIKAAIRMLSEKILTFEQLNLPNQMSMLTDIKNGLVLVSGTTGSGKSTTLASIIEKINREQCKHIITIEAPIEYQYEDKKSVIVQREVGNHVYSFSDGVIDAMRQDPDIILVGELRDLQTISAAITAAETGHLVFATVHTKSVYEAVDRIVDVFPPEQQTQIRYQFSSVTKAIIQQMLLRNDEGKIVPINEMLMFDDTIANMFKKQNPINSIRDYMRTKPQKGNIHVVQNCIEHIKAHRMTLKNAMDVLSTDEYKLLCSLSR